MRPYERATCYPRENKERGGFQLNMPITPNALFHADCVEMMQRVDDESIDLIYLDPPLFTTRFDRESSARGRLDTHISKELDLISKVCQQGARVLKRTGALYLHAKPASAFSIKLILNQIFGEESFRDEIVWQHPLHSRLGARHDVIMCYGKSLDSTNNRVFRALDHNEIRKFSMSDKRGRYTLVNLTAPVARADLRFEWHGITPPIGHSWRFNLETLQKLEQEGRIYFPPKQPIPRLKSFLTENAGVDVGTIWSDIPRLSPKSGEAVKYPLQKPLGLLERLVQKGSHEGEVVLDPFCGSGTTLLAAERQHRRWIACDTSKDAIEISTSRLMNGGTSVPNFAVGDIEILQQIPARSAKFKRIALKLNDYTALAEFEYILNHPVHMEETRHFEFKEIKSSTGAVNSIVNTSDEYAVAFLNSEGGSVFWGIRNNDRVVVGVPLNFEQRDKVRRDAHAKLSTIEPRIDPSQYRLEMHDIYDELGAKVPDICIVELVVPRSNSVGPYYTGGGEAWVKVDGSKQKLKGPALTDFIRFRIEKVNG